MSTLPVYDILSQSQPARRGPVMAEVGDGWARQVRRLERLREAHPRDGWRADDAWLARHTCASFRLDGLKTDDASVAAALRPAAARRAFRSRLGQRARVHAGSVLLQERQLRARVPLSADEVLRWFAGVSSGLCTTAMPCEKMRRLRETVAAVASPPFRVAALLPEAARLHAELLRDELVPAFNDILCRLLLHYQLGRAGLPPVILRPEDAPALRDADALATLLAARLDEAFAAWMGPAGLEPAT